MLDRIMTLLEVYISMGLELASKYLFTVEGIVGIIFAVFFIGLITQLRS